MEAAGYVKFRNPAAPGNDGLFKIGGKSKAIYVKKELDYRTQHIRATELCDTLNAPSRQ